MRRGTYSIVARDPATGELGVAVQSHWFSVGSVVSAARAEVGAVASQSIVEPAYRDRLLGRLEAGRSPAEALSELLAADEAARFRQVGVINAAGETAVHTGEGCIEHAGDRQGPDYSAQANMMVSPEVWPSMAEAFERSAGGLLASRLLDALDAAEEAGGDIRGRQSAALVVVPPHSQPWWRGVELRVEDHAEPLAELRRLLRLHEAYTIAGEADEMVGEGRHTEAADGYRRAAELAPDNAELIFWAGLAVAADDDVKGGAAQVAEAIERHPGYRDLLARLDPEIAPSAQAVRRELGISR